MLVENFRGHIWNQANLLISIPEFEKSRRTLLITTHTTTHRDNKVFEVSKKADILRVFENRSFVPQLKIISGPHRECSSLPSGG